MAAAGLGCGATTAKYILLLFNVAIFLCGIVILGTSLWVYVNDDTTEFMQIIQFDQDNPYLRTALLFLIICGIFIFMVGFLGCCGAWKENPTMLTMYAVLLVVAILGEIIGVGLALYSRNMMTKGVRESMAKQVKLLNPDPGYGMTEAWFHMQEKFECCGGIDYRDYQDSKIANDTKNPRPVPESCCKLGNNPQDYGPCKVEAETETPGDYLHREGCYDRMVGWLQGNIGIVAGVCFGIILIEIIGIFFACCIKNELQEYNKV